MIKTTMVKYKHLTNQRKQIAQPVIREQRVYLVSVIVLCIYKRVLIFIVIINLYPSSEQIRNKYPI